MGKGENSGVTDIASFVLDFVQKYPWGYKLI
jgi:hypothetical protein